jgi:NAD+ kinase
MSMSRNLCFNQVMEPVSKTSRFKKVAIIGRQQTTGIQATLIGIAQWLEARGIAVVFEAEGAAQLLTDIEAMAKVGSSANIQTIAVDDIPKSADLAIVVGGDGTMLGLARSVVGSQIPLLGINHGRLGFMTDVPLSHWPDVLEDIFQGNYKEEIRSLLTAKVMRNGQAVFSAPALNDVVISRGSSGRMVDIQVDVDGVFMYAQRADGLIVSTPTGSTAYALSANGPILYPSLAGIVLVPVAPQSLSNRPIVLPETCKIAIRVQDADEARVHCDMQVFAALEENDVIEVSLHETGVHFIHPPEHSFFATLRQKLNWHAAPQGHSDLRFADRRNDDRIN